MFGLSRGGKVLAIVWLFAGGLSCTEADAAAVGGDGRRQRAEMWTVHENPAAGDCMFEALVDQVYGPTVNVEERAMELRGRVVEQMRAQDGEWWDDRKTEAEAEAEARSICFKLYEDAPEVEKQCWDKVVRGEKFTRNEILAYMGMPKVFGTNFELALALELLRVQANIWFLREDGDATGKYQAKKLRTMAARDGEMYPMFSVERRFIQERPTYHMDPVGERGLAGHQNEERRTIDLLYINGNHYASLYQRAQLPQPPQPKRKPKPQATQPQPTQPQPTQPQPTQPQPTQPNPQPDPDSNPNPDSTPDPTSPQGRGTTDDEEEAHDNASWPVWLIVTVVVVPLVVIGTAVAVFVWCFCCTKQGGNHDAQVVAAGEDGEQYEYGEAAYLFEDVSVCQQHEQEDF